ncbi:molybdate ABC transporter substrate-binding protein [Demequina aurantiaca]|uniref:molybdate ABC transporter substrate-binding protein n=1 Tax=Demequina aurantiaca TaxID=676200 RepID=UPI0007848BA7|nr:molybdate ABC transporter substrate-binding protein [Demequina aurantiaca]
MSRAAFTFVSAALACTALSACSPNADSTASGHNGSETITVFAAASLTEPFAQIAENFEDENPALAVTMSFAGSADLATQIVEGAPADVFASANEAQMQSVVDAGLTAAPPVIFATNEPTIVVPADNPAAVSSFADLANPEVATVVCAPQVPCGAAELAVETATGVDVAPVSEESSVTDVLGKVTSGQADAGIVYVTDVARAGAAVIGIPIDGADAAVTSYPIASVTDADPGAQAFVDYVTSPAGQAVLADAGFGTP